LRCFSAAAAPRSAYRAATANGDDTLPFAFTAGLALLLALRVAPPLAVWLGVEIARELRRWRD
jgi:hypothetical protein